MLFIHHKRIVFRKWIDYRDFRCFVYPECSEVGKSFGEWGFFCGQNESFFGKCGTFRKESSFGKNSGGQKADLLRESEKSPCLEAGNGFKSSPKGMNSTRLFASLKGVQKKF